MGKSRKWLSIFTYADKDLLIVKHWFRCSSNFRGVCHLYSETFLATYKISTYHKYLTKLNFYKWLSQEHISIKHHEWI